MLVEASLYVPGPLEAIDLAGLTFSVGVLPSGLGLLVVLVEVSPCLGLPAFPTCWVPLIPAWLALAFFTCLAQPDTSAFGRWSLPTLETKYIRPTPSVGVLELLAP
jgi:hypothetical protein